MSNNHSRPPRPTRPQESGSRHNSNYDFYPRPSFKNEERQREVPSYGLEKEFGTTHSKKKSTEKRPRRNSAYAFETDYLEEKAKKQKDGGKTKSSAHHSAPKNSPKKPTKAKSAGGGQAVATKKPSKPKTKQKSSILPILALILTIVMIVVIFRACSSQEEAPSSRYSLAFSSQSLVIGETATVGIDGLTPDFEGTINWLSSDSDIVSINNGLMQAKAEGTATISAKIDKENVTGTVQVVSTIQGVQSLTLTNKNVSILSGESFQLDASVIFAPGQNASHVPIVWSTANSAVARVSTEGLVTARDVGTVTITATAGNQSDVCTITVAKNPTIPAPDPNTGEAGTGEVGTGEAGVAPGTTGEVEGGTPGDVTTPTTPTAPATVTSIALSLNAAFLDVSDGPLTLEAYTNPNNSPVSWSSSNASVATVSPEGIVTAVSAGTVIITAQAGSLTAPCSITVTAGNAITPPTTGGEVAIPDDGNVVAPTVPQ